MMRGSMMCERKSRNDMRWKCARNQVDDVRQMVMVNGSRQGMEYGDVVPETYVEMCGYNNVRVQGSVVQETTKKKQQP